MITAGVADEIVILLMGMAGRALIVHLFLVILAGLVIVFLMVVFGCGRVYFFIVIHIFLRNGDKNI